MGSFNSLIFLWCCSSFTIRLKERLKQLIWDTLYFNSGWQVFFNIFNSIPIFIALLLLFYYIKNKAGIAFSLSAIIHAVIDLLLHREDAHAHFFPFTDWIFMSPFSYWDPAHGGMFFSIFEMVLSVGIVIYVWKYFKKWWSKTLLVLAAGSLVLMNFMWFILF